MKKSSKVLIVDYGIGNLNSVKRTLSRLGIEAAIGSNPKEIALAEKIILPGVGHFAQAMANLKQFSLIEILDELVIVKKKPILGICLGMQLFAEKSQEGYCNGFGWVKSKVVRFKVSDKLKFKVPHMGWNRIHIKKQSFLMKHIEDSEFYFSHSYHLDLKKQTEILGQTLFDYEFTSVIEKENIFGVQFHPEKSHDMEMPVLKNFIEL